MIQCCYATMLSELNWELNWVGLTLASVVLRMQPFWFAFWKLSMSHHLNENKNQATFFMLMSILLPHSCTQITTWEICSCGSKKHTLVRKIRQSMLRTIQCLEQQCLEQQFMLRTISSSAVILIIQTAYIQF